MKNHLISAVIWAIVSVLWTVLAVWRIADGDEPGLILLSVIVAILSIISAVLNFINYVKTNKK